jgi:ubiquinone/menaquinone biosynthesis C-methylase UbiE
MGAGTGRLTRLLAPVVRSIQAFDASEHMLELAESRLQALPRHNWRLGVCDHRRLAAEACSADITIAGWSICYLVVWNHESWQEEVRRSLAEMRRVLRPGGTMIILETLGTGTEVPLIPENLAAYYAFLEESGFSFRHFRTDYRFPSMAEAGSLCTFFFGETMAEKFIADGGSVLLPECTGLWWLQLTPV